MVYKADGKLKIDLTRIAELFSKQTDGTGPTPRKKYWMMKDAQVAPSDHPYTFGTKPTYRLHAHTDLILRPTVLDLSKRILKALGIELDPRTHGIFTVMVRYQGEGVGFHKDDDYNTDDGRIISVNLSGSTEFRLGSRRNMAQMKLEPGDIVVFRNDQVHSASASEGENQYDYSDCAAQ